MAISNIPSSMTAPPPSPGGGNASLAGSLGSPRKSSAAATSAWKPLPPLLTRRTEAGICTAILHGRSPVLVVAGGRTTSRSNNNENNETMMMISPRVELLEWSMQRRWWRLPNLTTPRYGFAMVGIGAQLFCIGGLGNHPGSTSTSTSPYASMETLTLGKDDAKWQVTTTNATAGDHHQSLPTPRMYPAAVTYSEGGSSKILVVGGRDASLQELDTCDVYSLKTQRWNQEEQLIMPPMDSPRFACGLVYVPSIHVVVAVGGYNGSHWTTSCESYDIEKNSWKNDIPPMLRPVQFVSATLLSSGSQGEDYIVVRGVPVDDDGDNHEGAEKNVAILQCYNILTEEWMILPPTSSLVGAAMTSIDQTRIVTVGGGGGGGGTAASKDCRFWMPNLTKLFREDNPLDASLKFDDVVTMSGSVAASAMDASAMDESTVHPWLYGPSGSASVAASVARSVAASAATTHRRKVEDEPLLDNFGVQVRFTGYLHGESGRPQGKGRMTWTLTGDRYEGRFEQGARFGKGHMMYHNGDTFVGYFQDDRREGKGTYQYRDGRVYEGNYQMDLPNDTNGVMTWKDGTKFVGEFRRAKRTGKGKLTFHSSNVTYEGDFVNGRYQGFGRCQFQDESVYEGEWKSGKAHGIGRLVAADGSVIHDGRWANDGPVYDDDE